MNAFWWFMGAVSWIGLVVLVIAFLQGARDAQKEFTNDTDEHAEGLE